MGAKSVILVVLVMIAVGAAPLRPAWVAHHDQPTDHGHLHRHEHSHDGHAHSHAHHHHRGEGHDEESEDHHGVLDHLPDVPATCWTAPRRIEVDAPPTLPSLPAVGEPPVSDWEPKRRAKPPPLLLAPSQHLTSIRTFILRL